MLETATAQKYQQLKDILLGMGSVAVAFSGGVDSSLLAKVAHDVLGDDAIAVTAQSHAVPAREVAEAATWCASEGMAHYVVEVDELAVPGFAHNPTNRCYLCKHEIFGALGRIAAEQGVEHLAEGSNLDDLGDYRPGLKAIEELGVRSPLREAGLRKQEIRDIARELGIPMWDKPAAACLASRFAYGDTITVEKLIRVERSEAYLRSRGFGQLRVRVYGDDGDLARIEVLARELGRLLDETLREDVVRQLKSYGFRYVTVDLAGFRSGSMNDVLG